LGGVEGGKTVIRICNMRKNSIFNKKKQNETKGLISVMTLIKALK